MDNPDKNLTPSEELHKNRMRFLVIVVLIILSAIGLVLAITYQQKRNVTTTSNNVSAIAPAQVSITPSGFIPQTVTIVSGQAVIWTNNDKSAHQIASDPYPKNNNLSGLNSGTPIISNRTYTYIFHKAGTYTYHDNLNPYAFKGTVIVK